MDTRKETWLQLGLKLLICVAFGGILSAAFTKVCIPKRLLIQKPGNQEMRILYSGIRFKSEK